MKIFASVHPLSDIKQAKIIFDGGGARQALLIGAGAVISEPISLETREKSINFKLTVTSEDREVDALAQNIPTDAEIHLFGVNRNLFVGTIVHADDKAFDAKCELRCTSHDKPVVGPGCIPCRRGRLVFQLCC
jgi:hypothetical protein